MLFSSLVGMFIASFAAATLVFPLQSELVFVALQTAGNVPLWLLVTVASIGNTLGAFVNYALGLQVHRFQGKTWNPVTPAAMERAENWFRRFGVWSLLLSWAPFGDAITLIAGALRTPLWQFALLVSIAKTGRYIVLAWIAAKALAQVSG
jgi:membrane protein YqaA with SNARE-associated domain